MTAYRLPVLNLLKGFGPASPPRFLVFVFDLCWWEGKRASSIRLCVGCGPSFWVCFDAPAVLTGAMTRVLQFTRGSRVR